MGIWLVSLSILVGIWLYSLYNFRQKNRMRQQELEQNRMRQQELEKNASQLTAKDLENLRLKEENLKIKSGKDKLKENLKNYQQENKKLQEAARKKRKERSDAGKHRDVSTKNKRSGKPKGAKGGGLKNPNPKEIDYTREHYLDECPKCNNSLKEVKPFDHHEHYLRDLEKLKRGIQLVFIKHVIYRYKCPHCKKIVSKNFGNLANARYGLGTIAFVLYERLQRGGSWEGIRSTLNRIIHTKECVPTVKAFIDWIRKYEKEMWEVYDAFIEAIGQSSFAYVDETGLPMDGENWWLWCIVAVEVVLYLPSKSRGSDTINHIFADYKGILLSDFWSAYNKLTVEQQKCLEHLSRELRKITLQAIDRRDTAMKDLTIDDALQAQGNKGAEPIPPKRGRPAKQPNPLTEEKRENLQVAIVQCNTLIRQLMTFHDFFKQAWKKDGNDMSVYTPMEHRIRISEAELRLKVLIQHVREEGPANADIERMIKRFEKYGPCLFTYLEHLDIMPDNNEAERAIRPFVVQRKISGNFISPEVMDMYALHLSLYRTCQRNGVNYEEVILPLLKGDTDEVLILLGLKERKPPPVIKG